jgi:hypothetical protein
MGSTYLGPPQILFRDTPLPGDTLLDKGLAVSDPAKMPLIVSDTANDLRPS